MPMKAGLEMLTVASESGLPPLSRTWPEIAPVCLWPNAGGMRAKNRNKVNSDLNGRDIILHSLRDEDRFHEANAYYASLRPHRQYRGRYWGRSPKYHSSCIGNTG